MSVLIIAECGSSWRFGPSHLDNAYRMIRAAKECGADAVKFQWTSDGSAMAERRYLAWRKDHPEGGVLLIDAEHPNGISTQGLMEEKYKTYLEYDEKWLYQLKAKADHEGIEFMVTCYLPQDVAVIAPLVKRFKVSAFESSYEELLDAIPDDDREVIISVNPGVPYTGPGFKNYMTLHCVSEYPTSLEHLRLRGESECISGLPERDGLSDHSGHVLAGAVAVGAGASVIEAHIRLPDTPKENPDYPHSHSTESGCGCCEPQGFPEYVSNIRLAERMVG